MHLILSAQDIRSITFGVFDGEGVHSVTEVASSPEGYFPALDVFLSEQSLPLKNLEGVIVVTGPGSFTASRVSTTIANSIAFTQSIPVVGLENPERLDLPTLLQWKLFEGVDYVIPSYDRPPLITKSKPKMGINSVTE